MGFGPLDRLLADPSIENVHANGCDRVFITRAGGDRARGPALAATDAELIELIRRVAAQGGRTERRFDDARPLLNLRLPDGSRLSAVMHVAGRPSLSVRRHRHTDVGLADLVRLGTLGEDLAAVMAAAVRRPHPFNIVVAGGTDAGKTTFLRALLAEVEPSERLVVIEDALELQLERDRRAASRRRRARDPRGERRGRGGDHHAGPCAPRAADGAGPGDRRRGPRRRGARDAPGDEPGERRLALHPARGQFGGGAHEDRDLRARWRPSGCRSRPPTC